MFANKFTGTVYDGETITCETDGFTVTATIHHDDNCDAPWEREDGHGDVSDWTRRDAKGPGDLILNSDSGSVRLYAYAAACATARRDGWGPPMYRQGVEHGANGLSRVSAQWFIGRDLHSHQSAWSDDVNAGYVECHDAMRASYPSARAYAAAAARADFDRLAAWCRDEWHYVGVSVTVSRNGVQLTPDYAHALWGIESDAPDYLTETATDLAGEALAAARETLAGLAA